MILVFDHPNVPKVPKSRTRIAWIGVGIIGRPLRRWPRSYHPFSACDFGLEEAIAKYCGHGDGIEYEDQQHHRVDEIDVQPIERHRDHQFEADPVEQRQGPRDFRIPWSPEPVRGTRRRRIRRGFTMIDILHVQRLSKREDSTASFGVETAKRAPVRGKPDTNPANRKPRPSSPTSLPRRFSLRSRIAVRIATEEIAV